MIQNYIKANIYLNYKKPVNIILLILKKIIWHNCYKSKKEKKYEIKVKVSFLFCNNLIY